MRHKWIRLQDPAGFDYCTQCGIVRHWTKDEGTRYSDNPLGPYYAKAGDCKEILSKQTKINFDEIQNPVQQS